ncbi:unnamed protein product [Trifolium pratense]|uniref:Uncharacterized protein n=1 Tax=Trifolium pratense TaxID=57577 RepID=A0ACB0J9C9_TRIPR|nr:unnamed protein product [Trifolium pratense]
MNFYEYLPHEYSYALYLADIYDLYPFDSMIHNMVSERYPRDEDEDCASAHGSENCEEDQVQEAGSSSAVSIHIQDSSSDSISEAAGEISQSSTSVLESITANDSCNFSFGNFHSENVQIRSIEIVKPDIKGCTVKIGQIECFLNKFTLAEHHDSVISQSTVPAFSSPIKVERQHDGNVRFSRDQDQNSKKGETLSDLLLPSSASIIFISLHRGLCITVFDPGGTMRMIYSFAIMLHILSFFNSVSIFPFDPGGIFLCQ